MTQQRERATHAQQIQYRSFDLTAAEFRVDPETAGCTFEGVASVVDTPYEVSDQFGTFTETIRAGAFNKTLRDGKADVALFINHDTRALPLATRGDGSLKLFADPHLRIQATLNPLRPSVQEARHAVNDGQARQMSIGFMAPNDPKKDIWNADMSDRQLTEVNLAETSIVWRGASPTTKGAMRSYVEFMRSLTDCEMTKTDARRAIGSLQRRFADLMDSNVEARLRDELTEMIGKPDTWVCVVDHTDSVVVYSVYGIGDDTGLWQLGYTVDAAGNVTLSSDTPVEVNAVTTYTPEPPEPGERSAQIAARDREDRARLERIHANRPPPLI